MLLIATISLLLALTAAEKRAANKHGTGWAAAEADTRYGMGKPKPVNYDPADLESFMFDLMEKLHDMPMPDDPNHVILRDENKQMQACEVPEDDDEAMETSANPDDVMDTVLRSFPDGKCAGRRFGEWYYQVCGNMAVLRSPYTVGVKNGRIKVTTFRAHESLGVVGRDRRGSRHLASVNEPRYVEQTYYGGAKCNVGGDTRRTESTVTFECNRRFVSGYVHIAEVVEEHPCKYRLQLQSSDFCDNDWLLGVVEPGNFVRCRIYFHPERIKPLMRFLSNYEVELDEKKRRYDKFMERPENKARFLRQLQRPDVREKMKEWANEWVTIFDRQDAEYGAAAERERNQKMIDYVMSELTWASLTPDVPYTEEEQRAREEEAEAGREEDERRLATIRRVLENARESFMDASEDEDERFAWEIEGFTDLLQYADVSSLRDIDYLNFYTSWLDYIRFLEAEDVMVVRSLLIPPNRKFPLGSYLLLKGLIKTPFTDSITNLITGLIEEEVEKKPIILYDGELDESDLEELARRFMQIYKEAKEGGDTLLFDLLDDEDFEYR